MSAAAADGPITGSFIAGQLSTADRIDLRAAGNTPIGQAVPDGAVALVREALAALPDPWVQPVNGVPIAPIRFDFHDGDAFVGSLGVARTFLVAQVAGGFVAYGLEDPAVEQQLLGFVGLDRSARRSHRVRTAPVDD